MALQGLCSLDETGPEATAARLAFAEAPTARDLLGHDSLMAKSASVYLRPQCADQTDEYDAVSIAITETL